MKYFIAILFIAIISSTGFSQKWEKVLSNDQLTIYVTEIHYQQLKDDIDHQRLIFKYVNKTSSPIEVMFNRTSIYDGKSYPEDKRFDILIPANGIMQYSQHTKRNKAYFMFKKDNQGFIKSTLDDFNITQLKIKTL